MKTINNREELFTWIRENIQQIDSVWIDTLESDDKGRIRICAGTERGNVRKAISFPANVELYPMELELKSDEEHIILTGVNTWLPRMLLTEMLKRSILYQ